jgi:hypothetical protein
MAVESSSSEGVRTGGLEAPISEAPTRQFAVFAGGEACANCGSVLSSDQRYCVACGERRGRARFPVADLATPAPLPSAPPPPPSPRGATWSGGMTLVTGIATLLLAMGVGVLIGRTGQGSTQKAAAAPSVITVNGGAAAPSTPTSASGSAGGHAKKAKPVKGLPPKKVIVKAQQQASKVLGGTNLPPPTVKVGQAGSGPGFQGGKFTGNFFGQ